MLKRTVTCLQSFLLSKTDKKLNIKKANGSGFLERNYDVILMLKSQTKSVFVIGP